MASGPVDSLERMTPTELIGLVGNLLGRLQAAGGSAFERQTGPVPRRGQGGVAGFAKGEAEVVLSEADDGTVLSYVAKATVGGKLAQIGQRLIDGAAKQIADDFFGRFTKALTDATPAPVLEPDPPVMAAPASDEAPAANIRLPRARMAPEIWIVGLVGVIAILLLVFGFVL